MLSSNGRHQVMSKASPSTVQDVMDLLSDETDKDYPLYRRGTPKDEVVTIATGIFDFRQMVWRIYANKSSDSLPIAVFPINI
jgi:hypothetical protein